jgi:GntR family transcriptional regulator
MFIRIQRGSSVPVSRQIDAQLRAKIVSGSLASGEQLPSVRELARELTVNVNTVFRVYERLAADGLVQLRHGEGTFVAPQRKAATSAHLAERERELTLEFDALVRRGLLLGLTPAGLRKKLSESVQRVQQDTSITQAPSRPIEAVL